MGICTARPQMHAIDDQRTTHSVHAHLSPTLQQHATVAQPNHNQFHFVYDLSHSPIFDQKKEESLSQNNQGRPTWLPVWDEAAIGVSSDISELVYEGEYLSLKKSHERFKTKARKNRSEIRQYHVKALVEANWGCLTNLGISKNKIGNIGCKWLSKARLPYLEILGVRHNEIEAEGVLHLSKMSCQRLRYVYMDSNKIIFGVKYLIKAIFPSIAYLNLQNNSILPIEIDHILVSDFRRLSEINLTWNRIDNLKEKEKKKRQFTQRYGLYDKVTLTNHLLTC